MTEQSIAHNSAVQLHFALKLADGQTVDTNFDGEPVDLVIGDGNLPEAFEQCLIGLNPGSEAAFEMPPEKAFGQYNEQNVQRLSRSLFESDFELSEGLVVSFADAAGAELPGVIMDFDESDVTVDFNHPLAGKTLTFEVKILSCNNPTA